MAFISSNQSDYYESLTLSHLKKRYYSLELTEILASYILVFLILNFPTYFVWIEEYIKEAVLSLSIIGSVHLFFLIIDRFSGKKDSTEFGNRHYLVVCRHDTYYSFGEHNISCSNKTFYSNHSLGYYFISLLYCGY